MQRTFSIALLALFAGCGEPGAPADAPLAATLAQTGIETLPVRPFAPQYPLWTDGAAKQRWVYLPSAIDGSGEGWQFPVGTKLWKQFSFDGVVAETRYMENTARGWRYATYVANADITIAPGVIHVAPRASDCHICHTDGPLGFSPLQLSPDRDPNAAHRETPPPGAIDLAGLLDGGLLRGYRGPREPRIAAASPTERAALGYLHGNCGGCHNRRTSLASLDLELTPAAGVHATAVGRASRFAPAKARIAPRAPESSVLVERMRARDAVTQMPPLGSQLVDRKGVELVSAWIAELP